MSEVSYRPLIEDMTWSYSRLKAFEDCPYKWFSTYIRGVEDGPTFYASYGSFLHRILERFYSGNMTKEEAQMVFLINFSKEVCGGRPDAKIVENYIRQGSHFLESIAPLPFKPVALEKKMDFTINNVKFTCIVDYLGENDDGLCLVDHKSRALKPRSKRKKPTQKDLELDDMLRQLYLYSEAVRQHYGRFPSHLCFNCFRTGEFIVEPFRETAYKEAVEWALSLVERICNATDEDFHPYIEYFGCRYLCGAVEECCYANLG